MKIFSYRPGCAKRRTVFENQLLLYAALQSSHGYKFKIAVDKESHEPDDRFEWLLLNHENWASWRGRHWHLNRKSKIDALVQAARGSDGILTIDPVVYPQALLAFEAAAKLDIPVWFDATITLLSETLNTRWYSIKYRLLKRLLSQTQRILIPSPKVMERFHHLELLDDSIMDRFQILGHPIDVRHFQPRAAATVPGRILCVSRLVPEKGIAYILEAFAIVSRSNPDAHLHFIGKGPMENWIRQRSLELGVDKQVSIIPPVRHGDLPALLQTGACAVNHSLSMQGWEEYFGVANLEAMACGLPVISTTAGGIPFALRPPAIFRPVAERDITGLADAMLEILTQDEGTRMHTVRQNRLYVEQTYTPQAMSAVFHRAIGQQLDKTHPPAIQSDSSPTPIPSIESSKS